LFLTEDNAVGLHGVARVPNTRGEGRKYADLVKNIYCHILGVFVYNKSKVKFVHNYNT
jgi:hypothetical protein